MGPWFHGGFAKFDQGAEYLRWFDYWLKGIDNGVLDEDPVHYYVVGADEKAAWRSSKTWPLSNEQRTDYFFHSGKSGSIDSINDGILSVNLPENTGADRYFVDYTTALTVDNRWTYTAGGGTDIPGQLPYAGQSENDRKGLTYTTDPLEHPLEVTGHPVAHLWIGSTADIVPLVSGEAAELVIELHPTAKLFNEGNRIRVTITCADKDTFDTPILDPAPEISLLRDTTHLSRITLPIIRI